MTRVIAGTARGRRLAVPPAGTRPTADRAREGLFSALVAARPGGLAGARVLDLFAGSGALGLEAASRGAVVVWLVEADARAADVCRRNAAVVGVPGVTVRRTRVEGLPEGPAPAEPFDLVLADPPYDYPAARLAAALAALVRAGWLADEAIVVVERSSRDEPFAWPAEVIAERSRRYGEATLWTGRVDVGLLASGPVPPAQ